AVMQILSNFEFIIGNQPGTDLFDKSTHISFPRRHNNVASHTNVIVNFDTKLPVVFPKAREKKQGSLILTITSQLLLRHVRHKPNKVSEVSHKSVLNKVTCPILETNDFNANLIG